MQVSNFINNILNFWIHAIGSNAIKNKVYDVSAFQISSEYFNVKH